MVIIIPSKLVVFFVIAIGNLSICIQCIKKILNFVKTDGLNTLQYLLYLLKMTKMFPFKTNTGHTKIATNYTLFATNHNFRAQK